MIEPERTFCGVPFVVREALAGAGADAAIFGAPVASPYPDRAVHSDDAPDAIRTALGWYGAQRTQIDWDHGGPVMGTAKVVDLGNLARGADSAANRSAIAGLTAEVMAAGLVPIVLGGDDSIPIPFIEGFAGRKVTVVQVDAHMDWRDEVSGERFGFSSTMRRASEMAHVQGMVQIGLRAPGSARAEEVAAAEAYGARLFPMRAVHRDGLEPALAAVPEGSEVVLTIDADGLDPALCPGVLSPAFGGMSYQRMLDLIEGLAGRCRIVGISLVEYVPGRDLNGLGGMAVARILCNLIARLG